MLRLQLAFAKCICVYVKDTSLRLTYGQRTVREITAPKKEEPNEHAVTEIHSQYTLISPDITGAEAVEVEPVFWELNTLQDKDGLTAAETLEETWETELILGLFDKEYQVSASLTSSQDEVQLVWDATSDIEAVTGSSFDVSLFVFVPWEENREKEELPVFHVKKRFFWKAATRNAL